MLLTPVDVSGVQEGFGANNGPSDGTSCCVYQVWDGGVRGVNDIGAVDIGSLCMLIPPVNSLASQIFHNIPSNPR